MQHCRQQGISSVERSPAPQQIQPRQTLLRNSGKVPVLQCQCNYHICVESGVEAQSHLLPPRKHLSHHMFISKLPTCIQFHGKIIATVSAVLGALAVSRLGTIRRPCTVSHSTPNEATTLSAATMRGPTIDTNGLSLLRPPTPPRSRDVDIFINLYIPSRNGMMGTVRYNSELSS